MKKASLLLLIFISLTAFTCENEGLDTNLETETTNPNDPTNPTNPTDPTNPSDPTSIVGTWRAASLDAATESSITSFGITVSVTSSIVGENLDYTVTFTDNDTFSTNGSYDITSTVVTPDETNTFTQSYTNVSGNGTYEITGANMMTVSGAFYDLQVDGVDTSAIADMPQELQYTLSADGQTLTFVQDQQQTDVASGVEIVTTVSATSVFTRE